MLEAEPEFVIAGACASVRDAWSILDRQPVDVVLLDYDLGEEQGSSFVDAARQRGFEGKVLMVTAGMTDADTLRALEAGCAGIFLKHSPPSQLVEAIKKVMLGEMWLDQKAVRSVVAAANGRDRTRGQTLSPRERSVLKGVFEGLTNKEIAGQLEISETSVKWVLQQLFEKTGVRTRSQLVRIALERHSHDWLSPGLES